MSNSNPTPENVALIIPELNGAKIRKTPDGRFSVYDLMRVAGGLKNPAERWRQMRRQYPDLFDAMSFFQFPGKGQKLTPVATLDHADEILALLGVRKNQNVMTQNKFFPKTESQIVSVLKLAFADCSPCTQFYCCGYRIDLYLADARIAIECDENSHQFYSLDKEDARESCIKSALGCSFVRFNPYSPDFNIGSLIFEIRGLI